MIGKEIKVFGDEAKAITDGEIFVAKVGSVEGRTVTTLTSIKIPTAPIKVQCSLCPQWWYLTDVGLEASLIIHEDYHDPSNRQFTDGHKRNVRLGKVEWMIIG